MLYSQESGSIRSPINAAAFPLVYIGMVYAALVFYLSSVRMRSEGYGVCVCLSVTLAATAFVSLQPTASTALF